MARSRDRILRDLLRSRFVVTTVDGATFEGLLVEVDDRTLLLADTFSVLADGQRVRVDGQLFIERTKVAYMQKP